MFAFADLADVLFEQFEETAPIALESITQRKNASVYMN